MDKTLLLPLLRKLLRGHLELLRHNVMQGTDRQRLIAMERNNDHISRGSAKLVVTPMDAQEFISHVLKKT